LSALPTVQEEEQVATHAVGLKIAHEIPLGKVDITLPVKRGNALLGTVTISRGGIDWKRAHARQSKSLTWKEFADLMATL
jgi:hypothetical protein